MRRRVGLATCWAFPDLEEPERALIPALADRGIAAVPLVWDDPGVEWSSVDLVVIRSTWDYIHDRDRFLDWVDRVEEACGILNDPDLVRWNTDKRYLRDLRAAGLPVVPTTFVEPAGDVSLSGTGDVVIKPSVSAGSQDTGRYRLTDEVDRAVDHARRLLAEGRTVMVQPYVPSVDETGETAMLYIDGAFSHAIRKGPLLQVSGIPEGNGVFVEEDIAPRTPTATQRQVADAVIAEVHRRGRPLYARVDLLDGPDGPMVLEVELTEPSMFYDHAEGAAARFATAISDRTAIRRG